jgi:hypothetical protein
MSPIGDLRARHYLRVPLAQADAGARVIDALAGQGVRAERGAQTRDTLVLLTDEVAESHVAAAAAALPAMAGTIAPVVRLRVEPLA